MCIKGTCPLPQCVKRLTRPVLFALGALPPRFCVTVAFEKRQALPNGGRPPLNRHLTQ
jgi:hypothetical protein